MIPLQTFYERALERHPDLPERFMPIATDDQLRALGDDRYLSAMTQRVFAAGFRWAVIRAKWDGFEEAFHGFDPDWVADVDGETVDALAQDTRIVRHRPKILSTIENASFVQRIAAEHGSFGAWIAAWPADDTVGLWAALKKQGSRLGGGSGPWFLRLVGKDTFRLSPDVVAALIEAGVVDKEPTSKKGLRAVQEAFNTWSGESGLPQGHVSIVLACSTGQVYGAS